MRKLPLLLFALFCVTAIFVSYGSYRDTACRVRLDLDTALRKTVALRGVEAMRQDSIRAYRAMAKGDRPSLTIQVKDEVLRRNLRTKALREKAYIAYDITPKNGWLHVDFRSEAACSAAMLFSLSDQRLSLFFFLIALSILLWSFGLRRRDAALPAVHFGGIWWDESCDRFRTVDNAQLPLTPMQHELMRMFFAADGYTLSKQAICDRLWPKKPDASATLYALIKRLKPVIEAHSRLKIESDRGRSYMLISNDVD